MSAQQPATVFSDAYGRLQEEFADQTAERRPRYSEPASGVREEIVRCIWFGSHFSPDLLSTDQDKRLEVVSPGWWNVEGGPDFTRAELLLEGAGRLVGDVEIHTLASSWHAHGHERQEQYNGVVLHVVMWNDAEGKQIRLQSGEVVPQLTLSRFVEEELEELIEIVDLEGERSEERPPAVPGRYCGEAVARGEIAPEWLGRLLDCAGDHKLLSKSDRMRGLIERLPREQVLYEGLAEALGYKSNRMPLLQLAGLLPLSTLREIVPAAAPAPRRREVLEAALFGAAGLLSDGGESDSETRAYRDALRGIWRDLPAQVRQGAMSPAHWTFGGTRPVNYPTRRIAALACLYSEHLERGLFGRLVRTVAAARPERRRRFETVLRDSLLELFVGLGHTYWSHRCTFGGRRLSRPQRLIGRGRAAGILVDVVMPLLLAHARCEGDGELAARLHRLWSALARRAPDAVVRRMCSTLFGDAAGGADVVNSARRQHGLHQLYRDSCGSDQGCARCVLYLAHKAGKQLTEV